MGGQEQPPGPHEVVASADRPPQRLERSFFARDAAIVARDLIGRHLHHGDRVVRIVETEAYVGEHDLACHASKGRTARTDVMFGPPGHAYVYLIYGMYDMLNIVTGEEGDAQAVLIRAAEPVASVEGRTDGPGRLCRALGVSVADHNGVDLSGQELWLSHGRPAQDVVVTPRINVDYAGAWADEPLRFVDSASRHLSRPVRPGARLAATQG